MSGANDLRRVAGLADLLLKAADDLTRAESIEQAISERVAHIASLDGEVAKRVAAIKSLASKHQDLHAQAEATERALSEARESRYNQLDNEVSVRREELQSRLKEEGLELQSIVNGLLSKQSSLLSEVDSLTSQRDLLLAEIDAAKQRVANL